MEAQLAEIQRSLGRIEGAVVGFTTRIERVEEAADCLEKRVRSVEHWRWYAAGALALGAALFGIVFG